jgi:hypothetical protein
VTNELALLPSYNQDHPARPLAVMMASPRKKHRCRRRAHPDMARLRPLDPDTLKGTRRRSGPSPYARRSAGKGNHVGGGFFGRRRARHALEICAVQPGRRLAAGGRTEITTARNLGSRLLALRAVPSQGPQGDSRIRRIEPSILRARADEVTHNGRSFCTALNARYAEMYDRGSHVV